MSCVLAEERKPSFVGLGPLAGLLAVVAMPLLLALWWAVFGAGIWFGPFLTVAGIGLGLFFVTGWRGAGMALVGAAALWFGLLLWLFSHLGGID